MYYSAIGVLAFMVLLIENQDILFNRNGAYDSPAWKVYRRFLASVLVYDITDILWGIIENRKLAQLLFIDTSVYFIAMAVGILFWTQYAVTYLEEKNKFSRFIMIAGRIITALVGIVSCVNVFVPVLFTVDENCVYHALGFRYAVLIAQILLLLIISVYALFIFFRHRTEKRLRYRTLALFGLIMAVFLFAQIWYPYLPLYAIAYMLGTCLIRAFVIGDENEAYRRELAQAQKIRELKQSISSLLDNMPALSFSKDAKTGVYRACNQAFADYARKPNPESVIGLTDAQIFDPVTAKHFVDDDHMALSMDEPYIFYEDVPDADGNHRQFQTTKLKFIDESGRMCTLGMSQDMTDMVRIQREHTITKEAYEKARSAGVIYTHIAQTLVHGYEHLYYINLDTEEYIEYITDKNGTHSEERRGLHFFEKCREDIERNIHPEDRKTVLNAMERRTFLDALDKSGTFVMTYRLLEKNGPIYVSMNASRMKDDDRFVIIGIMDIDEHMKQQQAAERMKEERIAYTRLNALTGDFICVYVVHPQTGHFREYSATADYKDFALPKDGEDFFTTVQEQGSYFVHIDDRDRFLSNFTEENIYSEIARSGIFVMSYRLVVHGKPTFVKLKAAMVREPDGDRLIVGVNNIDAQVQQEEAYARRLEQAQSKANIDALTGVKNKHAYLDAENRLNRQIAENRQPEFAIVILDVNDLKKVNDSEGHQAGDQYLRDASKIICDIFKHSPVFRVGGDEFAIIAQGTDYDCIEELTGRLSDHNKSAFRSDGITIACGLARFDGDTCVATVFERADQNMYENKSIMKAENSVDKY